MINETLLHNQSCALFLIDSLGRGLEDTSIISGTLSVGEQDLYFKKNRKEGFPLPEEWIECLLQTPLERSVLFRGCSYFITIEREEAENLLDVFHFEKRWGCWCPVEQDCSL